MSEGTRSQESVVEEESDYEYIQGTILYSLTTATASHHTTATSTDRQKHRSTISMARRSGGGLFGFVVKAMQLPIIEISFIISFPLIVMTRFLPLVVELDDLFAGFVLDLRRGVRESERGGKAESQESQGERERSRHVFESNENSFRIKLCSLRRERCHRAPISLVKGEEDWELRRDLSLWGPEEDLRDILESRIYHRAAVGPATEVSEGERESREYLLLFRKMFKRRLGIHDLAHQIDVVIGHRVPHH